MKGKMGLLFLGGAFAAIGVFLVVVGSRDMGKARISTSWPKTDCTVLKQEWSSSSPVAGSRTVSQTHDGTVAYSYSIGGITYTGRTIRFSAIGTGDAKYVKRIMDRYRVGKSVPLSYNPQNPSESVLEPGVFARNYLMVTAGAIFILVPFFLLGFPFKKRGPEKVRELQALADSFETGKEYIFHHEESGELIPCTFQRDADGSVNLSGPKLERSYAADPAACKQALHFLEINGYFLEES